MKPIITLTIFLCFNGAVAHAQLSSQYIEWIDGPCGVLLSSAEREQIQLLTNDRDAARFLALFWARRDQEPKTPLNEFRIEFEARVAAADQAFRETNTRGALTDRGRVFLLLGPPTLRRVGRIGDYLESLYNDLPSGGSSPVLKGIGNTQRSDGNGFPVTDLTRDVAPTAKFLEGNDPSRETIRHGVRFNLDRGVVEVWEFTDWALPHKPESDPREFVFLDRTGGGQFLLRTDTIESKANSRVLTGAPELLIFNPSLAEPSYYPLIQGIPAASKMQLSWFDQPLISAFPEAMFTAVRGVKSDGSLPAWIHAQLPEDLSTVDLIVGRLTAFDGTVTGSFQMPATALTNDRGRKYLEFEMPAPTVSSTIELMLFSGERPVTAKAFDLEGAPILPGGPYIMPVVAGARIEQVAGAKLSEPFVFGGHHLLLRPMGQYSRSETLNLFSLLANPGHTDNGTPDIWMSLRLIRNDDGAALKSISRRATTPVRIAPGVYMIGLEVPLEAFQTSGTHRLELSIHDEVSGTVRESALPLVIGEL